MEPLFLPTLESLRSPLPTPAYTIPLPIQQQPSIYDDALQVVPTGPFPGPIPVLTSTQKFESTHYTVANHYALDAYSMYVLAQANLQPPAQGTSSCPPAFTKEAVFELLDKKRFPRRFMVDTTPFLDQISGLNNFNEYTCFFWQQGAHFWLSAFSHDDCGATRTVAYLPRPSKEEEEAVNRKQLGGDAPGQRRLCVPIAFRYLMLMRSDAYACRHVFIGMSETEISAIFVTNQQGSLMRHTMARQMHPRCPTPHLHPFGDAEHILSGDTSLELNVNAPAETSSS